MVVQRRDFIKLTVKCSIVLGASDFMQGCDKQFARAPLDYEGILSGCDDNSGNHYIAHLGAQGHLIAKEQVPQRVHGSVAIKGQGKALFFARRPGTDLYQLDLKTGKLDHTFSIAKNRHFYGHGVINRDETLLYTTENNMDDLSGVIGVYELGPSFRKIAEIPSYGIGPHQLALLSDQKTLVVANGGMATHPSQNREILNLETMAPTLTYINVDSGELIEAHSPPHHKMSIRHLDVADNDMVVLGVQYQGDVTDTMPLVGSHTLGDPVLRWFELPENVHLRIQQYTASVAINSNGSVAMVSCPRGNMITSWDTASGTLLGTFNNTDAAGLYRTRSSWLSTNGQGDIFLLTQVATTPASERLHRTALRWDNHLTVI